MADQRLLDTLTSQLAAHVSENEIRASAIAKGWTEADVNGALAVLTLQHVGISANNNTQKDSEMMSIGGRSLSFVLLLVIFFSVSATAFGYFVNTGIPILSGYTATIEDLISISPLATPAQKERNATAKTSVQAGVSAQAVQTSAPVKVYHPNSYTYAPSPTTSTIPAAASTTSDPPTLTLTTQYSSVARGSRSTLRWSSTNATSCTSSDFGIGYRTSGVNTVAPNVTSTYSITCVGPAGSITKSVTVAVGARVIAEATPTETPSTPIVPTPDTPAEPVVFIDPDPVPTLPPPITEPPSVPPEEIPKVVPATVTSAATLAGALAAAKGGETITLATGNYGDFTIKGKTFTSPVTLRSVNPADPAEFRTFSIISSSNISVDKVRVALTPNATTYGSVSVFFVSKSTNISLTNSTVRSGPAVNGVAQNAERTDATGNVQGFPTGYGIGINNSSNILIQSNNVGMVDRGIIMGPAVSAVIVRNNEVHDTRRTQIVGAGIDNITIDGNYLHDIYPWHLGQTPYGDHADFLAFWTNKDQVTPSTNVRIINNRMIQKNGGPMVLCMWLHGSSAAGAAGFTNFTIRNNAFINNTLQGIALKYVSDGVVDHNVMLRTDGSYKQAPSILLGASTKRVTVTNNFAKSVSDYSTSVGNDANPHSGNLYIQRDDPGKSGYYDPSIVAQAAAMGDSSSIYSFVSGKVTGPLVQAPRTTLLASVISANAAIQAILEKLFIAIGSVFVRS